MGVVEGVGLLPLLLLPPHPVTPAARVRLSAIRKTIPLQRHGARRILPANGSRISPSATGSAPPPNGLPSGFTADWLARVTVMVTVVVPAPAAMVAGENVAVAPAGSPVTLKVIGAGNVVPLGGLRVSE